MFILTKDRVTVMRPAAQTQKHRQALTTDDAAWTSLVQWSLIRGQLTGQPFNPSLSQNNKLVLLVRGPVLYATDDTLFCASLLTLHGDDGGVCRGGGREDSGRRSAGSPFPVWCGPWAPTDWAQQVSKLCGSWVQDGGGGTKETAQMELWPFRQAVHSGNVTKGEIYET